MGESNAVNSSVLGCIHLVLEVRVAALMQLFHTMYRAVGPNNVEEYILQMRTKVGEGGIYFDYITPQDRKTFLDSCNSVEGVTHAPPPSKSFVGLLLENTRSCSQIFLPIHKK